MIALLLEYMTVYVIGAVGYGLLEIIYRGFTHWTMLLTGGACLVAIYIISNHGGMPVWKQCLLGASIITTMEFLVGILVNVILKWNVWDYSKNPMHLMGQICLPFSLVWLVLCLPVTYMCRGLSKIL